MLRATSINSLNPPTARACRRCGRGMDGARPTTVFCQDCDEVMHIEHLAPTTAKTHRRIARTQGWDIDDPAGDPWPEKPLPKVMA